MRISVKVPKVRVLDPRDVSKAVAGVLYRTAWDICTHSKEHFVPVAWGTLKSSIHAELPNVEFVGRQVGDTLGEDRTGSTPLGSTIFVELGAGGPAAPYALSVHENPRSGKTYGLSPQGIPYPHTRWSRVGQWKYLEVPFQEFRLRIPHRLRRALAAIPRRPR